MSHRFAPSRAPALLTIKEVAAQLQLSTKTVRRMIGKGELSSHRIGRAIRVDPHDLATLVHRSRAMPGG